MSDSVTQTVQDAWVAPPMNRSLLALLLVAAVVRIGALVLLWPSLSGDPDAYRRLAENVRDHGVLGEGQIPSAYRPPLYPLLLIPCVMLGDATPAAIAGLHLALGLGTVWLVVRLGYLWGLKQYAVVAGFLTACDPISIHQSAQVMTETLATLLAVLGLFLLTRLTTRASWGAAAGAICGAAILCRPTFLPWLACVLAVMAIRGLPPRQDQDRRHGPSAALAAVVLLFAGLVVAPWVARNQVQFGRPIIATTHGGYTLLLGNNKHYYRHLKHKGWTTVWDARELQSDPTFRRRYRPEYDELDRDRLDYAAAVRSIRAQPEMFWYSCLVRVSRFWDLLPRQLSAEESPARATLRYLVAGWYAGVYILGFAGIWALRRRLLRAPWLWGTLMALTFTAVHSVYWGDMRMRAPLAPLVALLAAAGWQRLRGNEFRKPS